MKILILSWKDPLHPAAGGAERYLVEVAKRWVASDHQVTILGPKRGMRRSPANDRGDKGIRYVGVGSNLSVFREARRYIHVQQGTFDRVLESVSTRPFAAHQIVGDRAVALYHQTAEDVWMMEYRFPVSWIGRYVLEPAWIRRMSPARVVAVSPSTAGALKRFDVEIEAVIPPGCDQLRVTEKRAAPSATPRLIWLGRLVRTKRPDDALAAFQIIRAVIPRANLDLVGGGYLEDEIRAQNYPGVTVHGFATESVKASLLSRADLLLLPGTREGWGIVAIEAASYGVPAVAYDIPGLRDVVLDGVTGVVVPPNEAALGLASASLLQDPNRWIRASRAGQQRAREYTWDRTAQQLLSVVTRTSVRLADQMPFEAWTPDAISPNRSSSL